MPAISSLFSVSSSPVLSDVTDSDVSEVGSQGYGAAWGDYDNDEDFDLYLSNWGENRLYRNDNGNFVNVANIFELESDFFSNGAGWGDFNNDGLIDLWAANFKREDDVYLNPGDDRAVWDNASNPLFMSATQDVVAADYNNDGQLGGYDIDQLLLNWQTENFEYELGPVVGDAPHFVPQFDDLFLYL